MEGNFAFNDLDLSPLFRQMRHEYVIDNSYFDNQNIKRGLRNSDGTAVLVGVTKIGSVQGSVTSDGERIPIPGELYYRGLSIQDILQAHVAENRFGYEEVSYLLLTGTLPNASELDLFKTAIAKARPLPRGFFEDTLMRSPSADIMNALQRGVLALYSYDSNPDDTSLENMLRQSVELIARVPTIVANAYMVKRHVFGGKSLYIHNPKEGLCLAENFLRLARSTKSYTDDEAKLLDLMLVLHAEHGGGNNSAFTCRVLSSSGTDTYSAIAGAIGSLKGPLHGGANMKVMNMFEDIKAHISDVDDDDALRAYLNKLLDGEAGDRSGKIYGLGHAVYTISDPRAELLRGYASEMAERKGRFDDFRLLEKIERLGVELLMERKHLSIPICANVDLYSGLVYSMLGIPQELFTPLFACARIAGWCAHRIEEVLTGNRLIRPGYRAAIRPRVYTPMSERTEV